MKNLIFKKLLQNVNFTYIPEEKFKTAIVSFSIFTPLNKNEVSKNAILPSLLSHSCKKFPNFDELTKHLENLYGSVVNCSLSKLGDCQVITLQAEGLTGKYATENPNNILDLTDLLCEMIFNPDLENEKFKLENLNQEKRQLIEDILSEMNNKKAYARRRCEEEMCKDEKFGINILGSKKEAENLSQENVTKSWKNLLENSHIEITVVGKTDFENIMEKFKEKFSKINRANFNFYKTEIIKKAKEVKEISEQMDVSQCKLVMGFRTEVAFPEKETSACILLNALFGGTAQSKLFLNVREKLSLCYYCSSKYNKHKGIMFVESGVEKEKVQSAKKEILKQLKEIKTGNFSDNELSETKLSLSQSIESIKDSLEHLSSWYTAQSFYEEIKSPDDLIQEINNVSREKIIEIANKITLDTVYLLKNKEKNLQKEEF